jgi:hypothetical protein
MSWATPAKANGEEIGSDLEAFQQPLGIFEAGDLDATPVEPKQWIVDQWLPEKGVINYSGHGESGKTYTALDLAMCCLMGRPWLGLETKELNSVFFLTAEQNYNDTNERIERLAQKHGFGDGNGIGPRPAFTDWRYKNGKRFNYWSTRTTRPIQFWMETRDGDFIPTDHFFEMVDILEETKTDLWIIDSILHYFWDQVADKGKVLFALSDLGRVADRLGCTILFLSHPTLTGLTATSGPVRGMGGAMEWHNQVDARLILENDEEDPDRRTLIHGKSRYGRRQEDIALKWNGAGFGPLTKADKPDGFDLAQRIVKDCNQSRLVLSVSPNAKTYYAKVMWDHAFNRDGKRRLITAKTKDEQIACWENIVRELIGQGLIEVNEMMNASRHYYQGLSLTSKSKHFEDDQPPF